MALSFGFALPNAGNNFRGDIFSQLLPADQRVEAASGTQEVANGCLDNRVVELRAIVPEVTNTNLLFNSSMAGATGSVLPTNWASGSVSGLTYTISSASTVQGLRSIEWTVSGTALSDGDLWLACEPMQSGTVSAQIPSEYVGSMYCAKVSGTIKAGMVLQTLTQNFINGAVQETITKDLAAVTGQTFVRIEPNSVKTDIDLENRVNLRLYQSIASGEVIDFTIRVAAPQVEAGFVASPFISTASGAVSEVRGRPSILVVPQLTKSGVVYPQLPVVSGADFTFTRATTATRVNASGLIESVASGLLRLDYPVTGGCPAGLIEASGTNLCLQSENFTTTWSPTNVTVSANVTGTTDPFGTNLADEIFETAASGLHFLAQTMSITSGTTYTGTIFFKKAAGSPDWMQVAFSTTGLAGFANFNLASGTVGNVFAGCTASIENYGNGWYRCRLTQTATASGTSGGPIPVFVNNTNSVTRFLTYTGNTATSIYVFGAQLETGAIPTSYIPTTTGSATRAADVCSVSGVSGYIGQTEGTIYAEFEMRTDASTRRILTLSDGNQTNRIMLVYSGNALRAQIQSTTISLGNPADGFHKVAFGYEQNGASGTMTASLDGGAVVSGTSAAYPTSLNTINLGKIEDTTTISQINSRIRAAAIYTTRLTNDQLANITRLT